MGSAQVESDVQLKHLGFVRIFALNAVVLVSNLYDYAKQNSGSLKSTVGKVENVVTAVVGPVYEKFKCVPVDLLVFIDNKVDELKYKLYDSAPPAAKNIVSKGQSLFTKALKIAQDFINEAQVSGPLTAISHVGTISKNYSITQFAVLWYKINQYPALHSVSEMAVPTASHWSEKYNNLVKGLTTKGYSFFSYVPLVPVEELAKAYKQVEAAAHKKTDSSSESESDKE